MKLCRDCKWYRPEDNCEAPANASGWNNYDLVDPRLKPFQTHRWLTASHQRGFGWLLARLFRMCGREGRWYEGKP